MGLVARLFSSSSDRLTVVADLPCGMVAGRAWLSAEFQNPPHLGCSGSRSMSIRLTREKLYELVWTKPRSQLAREMGVSDV